MSLKLMKLCANMVSSIYNILHYFTIFYHTPNFEIGEQAMPAASFKGRTLVSDTKTSFKGRTLVSDTKTTQPSTRAYFTFACRPLRSTSPLPPPRARTHTHTLSERLLLAVLLFST